MVKTFERWIKVVDEFRKEMRVNDPTGGDMPAESSK
jgi:hypothetical protein